MKHPGHGRADRKRNFPCNSRFLREPWGQIQKLGLVPCTHYTLPNARENVSV